MKKFFSLVLAVILALTCSIAFAEMDASTPISIEEQLSALDFGDLTAEDLIGEWRGFVVYDVYGPVGFNRYDSEVSLLTIALNIDEDGTGSLYHFAKGELPANVFIRMSDSGDELILDFVFYNGGGYTCMIAGRDHEVLNYMSYDSEPEYDYYIVCPTDTYYHYFTKEWESVAWPEANNDAEEADFEGGWSLVNGSVLDRGIDYDLKYGDAAYSRLGMPCDIDLDAGSLSFDYMGLDYTLTDFQAGVLCGEGVFNSDAALTGSILTDGSLLVCLDGLWYLNFEKAEETVEEADEETMEEAAETAIEEESIDPLTEYTDKETIQSVQAAMNDLGYECGTPDGISGKKTVAAVSACQEDNGLTVTGTITHELLEYLRTSAGYNF